ncbi:hypothetical protein [Nocardioides jejuensis]|nr:hypothetical protein [Nocardioides jejuensis]
MICEVWPGITPWSIWDLTYGMWIGFAASADAVIEERRKAAKAR